MIDLKPTVLQALESNSDLVALIGLDQNDQPKIYQLVAPAEDTWQAWVTFFEMNNIDASFADDEPRESKIYFQVDVWSRGSTSAIAEQVNITMRSLGFIRTSSADLYESDTQIYHKGMRYSIAAQND